MVSRQGSRERNGCERHEYRYFDVKTSNYEDIAVSVASLCFAILNCKGPYFLVII